MPSKVDVLIVGAGFSGVVVAEQLATNHGLRSLIVEKRPHLGGNAYDARDAAGVLLHQYGPHYFRTNSDKVLQYLSQFTEWQPTEYQVLSFTDGQYWPFPINLNTYEKLVGRPATEQEFQQYLSEKRVPIAEPANSEEVMISQVGWELYEKFFLGYTLKQWRRHPRDLDPSVCGRIPVRTNRDNRYLREIFQALPKEGYTRLFEAMLKAAGDKVEVCLNTDYRKMLHEVGFKHLVYTGPLDEFFDFRFGPLPYRSLRFETETFDAQQLRAREGISGREGFWQPVMQVNYPNDEAFTRIVEIKHATRQDCDNTTIVREYPDDFGPGKEPYYPVPNPVSEALRQRYVDLTREHPNVSFIGRLATYRYYNMDQVVALALTESRRIGTLLGADG